LGKSGAKLVSSGYLLGGVLRVIELSADGIWLKNLLRSVQIIVDIARRVDLPRFI
jgi:hypothetical protein